MNPHSLNSLMHVKSFYLPWYFHWMFLHVSFQYLLSNHILLLNAYHYRYKISFCHYNSLHCMSLICITTVKTKNSLSPIVNFIKSRVFSNSWLSWKQVILILFRDLQIDNPIFFFVISFYKKGSHLFWPVAPLFQFIIVLKDSILQK